MILFKWRFKAFREMRNLPAVVAEISSRAERIASSAGPGMETRPVEVGGERARRAVVTGTYQAARAEATSKSLTRALGSERR